MKALITSKSFGRHAPDAVEFLEKNGFELSWISRPSPRAEDIATEIGDCDCLIVGNDPVTREVFDAGRKLKLVHMNGTGLDAIDVDTATERGVLVANTPGANRNAVAELTVALMLCSARSIVAHSVTLQQGRWERSAGRELAGKTLGILGIGNIGKRVVELLAGFQMRVVAYDPCPDREWARARDVRITDDVDEVFAAADFLVLAAPLTPQTARIADQRRLSLMKPEAYLINTARGGLVDEASLAQAVSSGHLAGAAVDTFSEEPLPPDSPLRAKGITITPHLAASSIETAANVSRILARNVVDILLGGRREIAVNHGRIQARVTPKD